RSDIHVLAVVGPGERSVVRGIARLSERDYQMPLQRLLCRLVDSPDERVEQVILALLPRLRGPGLDELLHRDHRPADGNRVAGGTDENGMHRGWCRCWRQRRVTAC